MIVVASKKESWLTTGRAVDDTPSNRTEPNLQATVSKDMGAGWMCKERYRLVVGREPLITDVAAIRNGYKVDLIHPGIVEGIVLRHVCRLGGWTAIIFRGGQQRREISALGSSFSGIAFFSLQIQQSEFDKQVRFTVTSETVVPGEAQPP